MAKIPMTLAAAEKVIFQKAIEKGASFGLGLYGNPQVLGVITPAWQEPVKADDSAYIDLTVDGQDIRVYAPYNFDMSLTQVNLVVVEALQASPSYNVEKGKVKFSVRPTA